MERPNTFQSQETHEITEGRAEPLVDGASPPHKFGSSDSVKNNTSGVSTTPVKILATGSDAPMPGALVTPPRTSTSSGVPAGVSITPPRAGPQSPCSAAVPGGAWAAGLLADHARLRAALATLLEDSRGAGAGGEGGPEFIVALGARLAAFKDDVLAHQLAESRLIVPYVVKYGRPLWVTLGAARDDVAAAALSRAAAIDLLASPAAGAARLEAELTAFSAVFGADTTFEQAVVWPALATALSPAEAARLADALAASRRAAADAAAALGAAHKGGVAGAVAGAVDKLEEGVKGLWNRLKHPGGGR